VTGLRIGWQFGGAAMLVFGIIAWFSSGACAA
jgi:hypothetical protein